ncbi:MAG: hypothetical protein Q4C34_07810 [Bacteroidales bacterium]|nr:hypothetical protein [Bacteroidales bacterium]
MIIDSKDTLEAAARHYGVLPFFTNCVDGFSVEEMAAPGILFGDECDDYGCWDWKGPVIREQTTAYGKFFRRKAGFVSLDLLPHFLNYRRDAYALHPGTIEADLLEAVTRREGATSAELRRLLGIAGKRHSIEAPLQRLQMGGHLLIADFEYKYTRLGDRYGWGVALYSTPEIWLGESAAQAGCTPAESLHRMVTAVSSRIPGADIAMIRRLLR